MNDALHKAARAIADRQPLSETADGLSASQLQSVRELQDIASIFRSVSTQSESKDRSVLFKWRHLDVLEWIGGGSFGDVYRAFDPVLQREVALKLIRQSADDSYVSDAMAGEARRLAKVRHPNVLAIHGAGQAQSQLGIWFDLLSGETLEALLQKSGTLSPDSVLNIALDLSSALAAVHDQNLIHGDVKPANILVEADERPVLMDFGAARDGDQRIASVGSPRFLAPEKLLDGHNSPASDMYALGVLLFRSLTGKYPVESETLDELRNWHKGGKSPCLSALPRRWRGLIHSLLAVDPAARPTAVSLGRQLLHLRDARKRTARRMAVGAIVVSLIVGLVGSIVGHQVAQRQLERAEATTEALLDVFRSPRPSRSGRALLALDLVREFEPRLQATLTDYPSSQATVMQELAGTYLYFDDFDAVRRLSERALTLCSHCDLKALATIELRHHHLMTEVNLVQRDLTAAEDHARLALSIARERYDESSGEVVFALARMGDALLAKRFPAQARPYLEEAMAGVNAVQWKDSDRQSFVYGAWLLLLMVDRSMEEAEQFARWFVDWSLETHGERHSSTLSAYQDLTRILIETGQLGEASERIRHSIAVATQWLGEDDVTALSLKLHHALIVHDQGHLQESIVLLEGIRDTALSSPDGNQEILLVASGNLANRYKDDGQFDRAESTYKWVIERAIATLGSTHPRVLLNQGNLAEMYLQMERYDDAIGLAETVEKIALTRFGEEDPSTSFARVVQGRGLVSLGRHGAALLKLRPGAEHLRAKYGETGTLAMRAEFHLASALSLTGKAVDSAEALAIVASLVPRMREALGDDHAYFLELMELEAQLSDYSHATLSKD